MRKLLLIAVAALTLSACDDDTPASQRQVSLVATAPDGTKLWSVWAGGRYVYFASSGTQWRTGGKTSHTFVVPTVKDGQ